MDERTGSQRLSAADSLLWRIEADPLLRSPVLVVGLLDRSPTDDGLAATVERAVALLPRLRQRIASPAGGIGAPRWTEVAGSLADRVRRVRAPGDDLDAVLAVAEPDAAAAFDPARPPWTLTIVDGLDGGRSALVLRFHHAIADGVGAIEVADRLFDSARRPRRAVGATTAAPGGGGAPSGPWPLVPQPGAVAAAAVHAGQRVLRAATRPAQTLATATRLARSAARMLAPAATGSPELGDRSLDRWLAVTERPLASLRRAADAAGGTVNDVLLAAVAGALAAYHRAQGRPIPAVRVTMPISTRRTADEVGGNRFVPARFTLPIDDPDPRARIRIAGAISRAWQAEPAVGVADVIAAGLNLLPRPLVSRMFGGMLRSIDVDVADVPGLERPAFLGGARIERLWAFAPPAGAALSVTLLSHGRSCDIGLACDRAAVADPELLQSCLEAALTDVVAVGRRRAAVAHGPVSTRAHEDRRSA